MQNIEYILAHGSSNLFVMIDAVAQNIDKEYSGEYVRQVCQLFGSDGLLFVEQDEESGLYRMNMYNTDGTRAEMCGNGMRIVARYVDEQYLQSETFTLLSGGRRYPIVRHEGDRVVLSDGSEAMIPNYGVEIEIRRASEEFLLDHTSFVARVIEELDPTLKFTYLNLGNPHVVAQVESIDLDHLSRLGERVKELTHIFTRGVNVSFMSRMGEGEIFVATYERGVGLTPSCGTAMTASSTVSTLLGLTRWGEVITVRNRGGFVKCICSQEEESGGLTTQLIGNATYVESGVLGDPLARETERLEAREVEAWSVLTK